MSNFHSAFVNCLLLVYEMDLISYRSIAAHNYSKFADFSESITHLSH